MLHDEFIRKLYPPPTPDDPTYDFYDTWGYEQWLIKTQQHDLEQLRALTQAQYDKFRMAEVLGDCQTQDDIEQRLHEQGVKTVRAAHIISKSLQGPLPPGYVGVLLFETKHGPFCWFPYQVGFSQIIGIVRESDIERTGEPFTTFEALDADCDKSRVSSVTWLKKRYIELDNERYYVWDARSDRHIGRLNGGTLTVSRVIQGKRQRKSQSHDLRVDVPTLERIRVIP